MGFLNKLFGTNMAKELKRVEPLVKKVEALEHELGLDRPVLVQYGDWVKNFISGDWGTSYSYRTPVKAMVMEKLPATGAPVVMAFVLTVVVSFPLGILVSRREGSVLDKLILVVDQICMSIPPVFVGILLCFLFGITLRVFTPGRFVPFAQSPGKFLAYMFFPALAVALGRIAVTVKMLRSSILEEMNKDYLTGGLAQGLSRRHIIWRQILPNSLLSVITMFAMSIGSLLGGATIVETIFEWRGVGKMAVDAISVKDFPIIQGYVLWMAIIYVTVNLLVDISYHYLDPRIRLGGVQR